MPKDSWELNIGWGDIVQVDVSGRLFVGNPHRNYAVVYLSSREMRRIAKRLLKAAGKADDV